MRGSRKRGLFRRRLAGFLAACLVVTNLQGLTFAYGAEDDVIEEQAQLIQLDMSAMQAAVQQAAEDGVLITAPEMAASAANAWELPFTNPAYELSPGNIEALLAEGSELPADTSLRIFLEPLEGNEEAEEEENGGYVLTGDENLIFLIGNEDNEAQAYQIQFGDKVTGVIVAESRKQLRKELNGEEEEDEFVGGGAVESTEAPVVESTEAATTAPTEESSQAVEESTEVAPGAGTEESTEAESESESQAETEESSNAETEESSQAETAEPETEETTEAVTEETSPAETTPEASTEESTPAAESEGETEAETSTETVTEATTEGTTSESTETETETEEATETVTEVSTEAATDSASVDSLEDAVVETEDAGNEDGGDEPVVVVEEEEEADVPEEGQVAPENESSIAALWKTTVNFLTGNITAHAAGTATPPEATETEPESESENESQGSSGSNGGSGSAGGSQAEDDTDVTVATGGNADQKPGKKPEKEKVFTEAEGLEGLTTLNIDAVNLLVDGGLKRADGENMMASVFALFADGGEKSVAMFALPLSAVLAAEAGKSKFAMTLYDYSGIGTDASHINNYLRSKKDPFRFGAGHSDPWNAWDINKTKVNIYRGIVSDTIARNAFPSGEYLKTDLFPGRDVIYRNDTVIKHYPIINPENIFTQRDDGYYVYDSKTTPVRYVSGQLIKTTNSAYKNKYDPANIQENLRGGFWPFKRSNFYHGMKFSFDFSLLEDGMAENPDTGDREDMIFRFAGDDDVWVYLTDLNDTSAESRLVLDVGGDHNSMTGTINFRTGEVQYERTSKEGEAGKGGTVVYGIGNKENGPDWYSEYPKAYLYTEDDWIQKHPGKNSADFNDAFPLGSMNLPRKELAQYRLDFYYLERGGNASNCYLEFNTPVIEKDKVTVAKKVVSENENLLNGTYEFELYIDGKQQKEETIEVKVQDGYGTATSEGEYTPDTHFTLKEVEMWDENGGPTKTEWINGDRDSVSDDFTVDGVIGQDTLLMCVNYYDDLAPTISKQAILDENGPGYYDLVLGVKGAETTIINEAGKRETYKAKNIKAYDTLSEHVDFELDDEGNPKVWLESHLSGGNPQKPNISVTKTGVRKWEIYVGQYWNKTQIAEINGNMIKWSVTDEDGLFGKDDEKKLHIAIKVTAPYKAAYEDVPNEGTGTHADRKQNGYYSNEDETAKVTYWTQIKGSTEKTLEFKKPVVRPADPKGTLTLTKNVEFDDSVTDEDFDPEFDFTITLNGILKDTVSVKYPETQNYVPVEVKGGGVTLNTKLGNTDSVIITGLNKGVDYTITEESYTNNFYTSEVTDGNVTRKGTLQGDNASVSVTYTNTVSAKPTMTLKKVVEDEDQVLEGRPETYKFALENVSGTNASVVKSGFKVHKINGDQKTPVTIDSDGYFSIEGAGRLLLVFEDSFDQEAQYRISEVDAGKANVTSWKIGSNQEEDGATTDLFIVEDGKKVTFTNTYYEQTLTVTKKLDKAGDFIPAATKFTFHVTFNGPGVEDINKIPYTITGVDASPKPGTVADLRNENDIVEFKLKANETIAFTDLPKNLTYVITEQELGEDLANYSSLVKIEATGADGTTNIVGNGGVVVSGKTASGGFVSSDAERTQNITYFNQIDWETGSLTITKNLVDEAGQPYKATEDAIFIFTVEKTDAPAEGAKYTVSINLKGESSDSITLNNLPYGTYKVSEAPHIHYKVEGEAEKSNIEVGTTAGAVTFTNQYVDRGYFSDVDITVNKVTPDGEGYKFKPEEAADSESETPTATPTPQPVASLPQDEFRFKDESDEDTYLV